MIECSASSLGKQASRPARGRGARSSGIRIGEAHRAQRRATMAPSIMSEVTCWTMILGAASGEASDRREFAARYLPVVRAYLRARWRHRLDAQELEDATQEVFVECLREGGVLDRVQRGAGEGFRAFLFGVTRNVAHRCETRHARRLDDPRSEVFQADALPVDEESLSRTFDRAWATATLREAMERLRARAEADGDSSRRAEILRLRFRDGLSIHDIAARWKVDRGYLHHELRRALRDFERSLKEVVAFHHPNAPDAVARECHELLALIQ